MCFVRQETKNEALYLREHRGALVEELAKTIVEKVRGEREQEQLGERRSDHRHNHQPACDEGSPRQNLWVHDTIRSSNPGPGDPEGQPKKAKNSKKQTCFYLKRFNWVFSALCW